MDPLAELKGQNLAQMREVMADIRLSQEESDARVEKWLDKTSDWLEKMREQQ